MHITVSWKIEQNNLELKSKQQQQQQQKPHTIKL